jgi:ribosomal protein L16/L10AE
LVPTLTALGEVLRDLDRKAEAVPLLEEAVRIASHKLPASHSTRVQAEVALRGLQAESARMIRQH